MVMVSLLSKSRGGALRNPDLPRARLGYDTNCQIKS